MASGTVTVTAYGINFDVDFWASKGCPGTHWEPPEYPELNIEGISINGSPDIEELLADFVVEEILKQLEIALEGDEDDC